LLVVLALGWFAGGAQATLIDPPPPSPPGTVDDVFLVISNEGSFGPLGGGGSILVDNEGPPPSSVTVINFTSWVGGTFPQSLDATVHGPTAAGLSSVTGGDFSQFLGHDFFFMGSVNDGSTTHLVLSGAFGTSSPGLDSAFESNLIDGITSMGSLDPALSSDAGVASMSSNEFFGYFADFEGFLPNDIFGIVDPTNTDYVDWQTTMTFGSTGTGEASGVLFGFTPGLPLGTQSAGGNGSGGITGVWTPVPEPGTMSLLLGAFGLGLLRRRRRRKQS